MLDSLKLSATMYEGAEKGIKAKRAKLAAAVVEPRGLWSDNARPR